LFRRRQNGSRRNVAGFRSQENLIQINRSSAARSPAALPESFVLGLSGEPYGSAPTQSVGYCGEARRALHGAAMSRC
jgi:hypothetical protein